MSLSTRQREGVQKKAEIGFLRDSVGKPQRTTFRLLSRHDKRKKATMRQRIGSGVRALWRYDALGDYTTKVIAAAHLKASTEMPRKTTYAAALFDAQGRPTDILVIPNQGFGSHFRGPTESHGASAERMDHRGHAVSQAQTQCAPGLHRALMTSQSADMNTAFQLSLERMVNQLIRNRFVLWEVHNEFSLPNKHGTLPRASHQHFIIASAKNEKGDDLRVHVNVSVLHR